jgi:hypothetical protein
MNKAERRTKLLNYLHNLMEDEPQRFNIGTYISAASPHDLETAREEWPERHRRGRKLECGTSACLVGHLPVLFPDSFFWSSGENVRNALVRLKENNEFVCEMVLEDFFGSSAENWKMIIYPEHYQKPPTLQDVLDRMYELHEEELVCKDYE